MTYHGINLKTFLEKKFVVRLLRKDHRWIAMSVHVNQSIRNVKRNIKQGSA